MGQFWLLRTASERLEQAHVAAQLEQGVTAIEGVVVDVYREAVHCGAGLGRTGTLLACYLVKGGPEATEAIARSPSDCVPWASVPRSSLLLSCASLSRLPQTAAPQKTDAALDRDCSAQRRG